MPPEAMRNWDVTSRPDPSNLVTNRASDVRLQPRTGTTPPPSTTRGKGAGKPDYSAEARTDVAKGKGKKVGEGTQQARTSQYPHQADAERRRVHGQRSWSSSGSLWGTDWDFWSGSWWDY